MWAVISKEHTDAGTNNYFEFAKTQKAAEKLAREKFKYYPDRTYFVMKGVKKFSLKKQQLVIIEEDLN